MARRKRAVHASDCLTPEGPAGRCMCRVDAEAAERMRAARAALPAKASVVDIIFRAWVSSDPRRGGR